MIDTSWIIAITIVVVVLGVFIWLRIINRPPKIKPADAESVGDSSVEYEWTARHSIAKQFTLVLLLCVGLLVAFLLFGEKIRENFSISQLIWPIIGVVISLLSSVLKKYTYQFTHDGLYKIDPGNKSKRQLLFRWLDLFWIKPAHDGFTYYLKVRFGDADSMLLPVSSKGKVPAGKHTMLVNSIIMSRGVPTSRPGVDRIAREAPIK